VLELSATAHETFERELRPALRRAGIDLAHWHELSDAERASTLAPFDEQISPVLIPLGVDPTHPFPFVSGLSLSVGAFVQAKGGGPRRLARVKVPAFLPRWWEIAPGRYTPVEEVIRAHFDLLFPEDDVAGASFFRVTRDADLDLDEERGSGDLVKQVEAGLYRRRRASDAVRLEVARDLDPRIRDLLLRELRLERDELYESPGLLDLGALFELYERAPSEHKDAPWTPAEVFRGGRGAADPRERRGVPHAARARRARAPPVRELRELGRRLPHHRRG
jgi:polyphosphate kinase